MARPVEVSSAVKLAEIRRQLLAKTTPLGGCLLWTGRREGRRGIAKLGERRLAAHRASYLVNVGPIPPNHAVGQRCGNSLCVLPAHLVLYEHVSGMGARNRAVTHCPAGHPYDAENTLVIRGRWRSCRACNRERARRRYAAKRAREAA